MTFCSECNATQVYLKDPFVERALSPREDSKQPVAMTQGAFLLSGQLVSLVVNVPNLSGNIQGWTKYRLWRADWFLVAAWMTQWIAL